MITVPILSQALTGLLHDLEYDVSLFSLHSLHRGGAMAAYQQGMHQIDIKMSGTVDQQCLLAVHHFILRHHLPLAVGLAHAIHATAASTPTTTSTASTSSTSFSS